MTNTATMQDGIVMTTEKRNVIDKFKNWYKEKLIDTGKAQDLEKKIDTEAKIAKTAIGIIGGVATIALLICPADGPFGELCTVLATPALIGLVSLAADLKKKILIGAKRKGEEAMGFGADGVNPDVEKGYEKIEDMVKDAKAVKEQLSKTSAEIEKTSAEFRAKEAEEAANAKEAQAAQPPVQEPTPTVEAQPEQIIPIELPQEDGPVLKR